MIQPTSAFPGRPAREALRDTGASVFAVGPTSCIVESRGVLVALQTAAYTTQTVREIRSVYRQLRARRADRMASIAVYKFTKIDLRSFGDDVVRQELSLLAREGEGLFSANALILDSPGIIAAAIRTAGAGIMLAVRPKTPTKFFHGIGEAIEWIGPQLSWTADGGATAHFDQVLEAMIGAASECH